MAAENNLGKDKVSRLVWRIAIPSMLGQFVSVLYSIVDRMYIGNIPEIGDVALAGVGVCGPVVTMVGSVAVLVGVGGAPLVSIRMGEEDLSAAKKVLANCFLMLIVFSVLLIGGILPFREPMLRLFGASDATYPFAEEYFTAYLCGTFFALAASGLNQFIICQGFAKIGMASVMLGAALNIVLDPVFIFALDMGVRGAAIATVISQAASAAFVIRFLFGKRVQVPITFGGYDVRVMGRVLVMGFTPFLIVAVDNVMIIAMNAILQRTGGADGDMLVTCNTIVQSFMLVVTMPLGGISGGTQGILGFNYGACRPERVRAAQKHIFILCAIFTSIMFTAAQLVPQLFVLIFTRDPAYIEMASRAIRIYTLGIIPLGIQYEIVDGFTGMGVVRLSLPLSFWRKLLYFVSLFVLPAVWGAEAVFFTGPISDFGGTLLSGIVYVLAIRRILDKRSFRPAEVELAAL